MQKDQRIVLTHKHKVSGRADFFDVGSAGDFLSNGNFRMAGDVLFCSLKRCQGREHDEFR